MRTVAVLLLLLGGLAGCENVGEPYRDPGPGPFAGDCVWVRGLPILAVDSPADATMDVLPCDSQNYINYRVLRVAEGTMEQTADCDEVIERLLRLSSDVAQTFCLVALD